MLRNGFVSILTTLAAVVSAHATVIDNDTEIRYRLGEKITFSEGYNDDPNLKTDVQDVQYVPTTSPLLANAPFLHLRKGDRLVFARRKQDPLSKFKSPDNQPRYYLFSHGQYIELPIAVKDGRLRLEPYENAAICCLLFDWELTLANAESSELSFPQSSLPPSRFHSMSQ